MTARCMTGTRSLAGSSKNAWGAAVLRLDWCRVMGTPHAEGCQ